MVGVVVQFYDRDGDDVISFTDLALGMSILCKGTQEEKVECELRGRPLPRSPKVAHAPADPCGA